MKAKLLITSVAMLLCVSCAITSPRQEAEEFAQGFVLPYRTRWGPERNWTTLQKEEYLLALRQELQRYYDRKATRSTPVVAQTAPIYQPLPEYHPHQSTTTTITPNNRGGYTAWGSDGRTQQIEPDGRGGWTIWNQ